MDLNKVRQDLHQIPELGFEEFKTQNYLLQQLKQYPMLQLFPFGFNGILAVYAKGSGPYTLFRADMDALPVAEQTGVAFASKHPGKMHACGHDVHMTVLLGLIDKVVSTGVSKNVLFLFQPAEEGLGGAKRILESKVLDDYDISQAFALHVSGEYPVGTVACCPGIIFGIPVEYKLEFSGKSAHAAYPHKGNDALLATFSAYQNVLLGMNRLFNPTDPVVFHMGTVKAGSAMNIVPENCQASGTMRMLSKTSKEALKSLFERSVDAAASVFGCTGKITYTSEYDPVVNDTDLYKRFKANLPAGVEFAESPTRMVGEDFGFFTSRWPGLLFWLGAGVSGYDLHHEKFLADEKAIPIGVQVFYSMLMAQ